jgi:catalase-peroxidase
MNIVIRQEKATESATEWKAATQDVNVFESRNRETDERKWIGTRVDLVSRLNSQLR